MTFISVCTPKVGEDDEQFKHYDLHFEKVSL